LANNYFECAEETVYSPAIRPYLTMKGVVMRAEWWNNCSKNFYDKPFS